MQKPDVLPQHFFPTRRHPVAMEIRAIKDVDEWIPCTNPFHILGQLV